jgi:DNA-binding NarL/FixJ family response regulator
MQKCHTLMIVDDYKLFGECLSFALSKFRQFTSINSIYSADEVLTNVYKSHPDVVLINANLPNKMAHKLTIELTRNFPKVKVLILGLTDLESDIREFVEAGARGYVLKEASLNDLKIAINLILRGETVCSPQMAYFMFSRLTELAHESSEDQVIDPVKLTFREIEILQLIAEGQSNKQIAN